MTSRRRSQRRGAKRHRLRNWVLGVLAVVLGLVAAAAVYAVLFVRQVNQDLQAPEETRGQIAEMLQESEPDEPFTILLIGVDNYGKVGDARSDTLLLGRVDPEQKRVWLVSIPRDTKAEIPGHTTSKINKAYQLGGIPLVLETVQDFTGVPINHYAEVDINGFRSVVDALGGVYVDVDVEINDTKAAAANYKGRGSHIDPGYQLLDGDHALVFVRSRNFVDADFTRMRHQQMFFKALARQALSGSNIVKLPDTVRTVAKFVTTDMDVQGIISVLMSLGGMPDENLETTTMRGEWISPFVYTDEEYKQYVLSRMMAGASFEATAMPSGVVLPPDVSVDVRNGAGLPGVADEAATLLRGVGFAVEDVGNARQSNYQETVIVYSGPEETAVAVAEALGIGRLQSDDGSWLIDTDVLVVVGADWPERTTSPR